MHRLTNYNFFCGTNFCTTMKHRCVTHLYGNNSIEQYCKMTGNYSKVPLEQLSQKPLLRRFPPGKERSSMGRLFVLLCAFVSLWANSFSQRQDILLNNNWQTKLNPANQWKPVSIPHNWDDYYGYRRLLHDNLHGDAAYKREIILKQSKKGKRFFLYFEGAGSYATVLLNGKFVGGWPYGYASFELDRRVGHRSINVEIELFSFVTRSNREVSAIPANAPPGKFTSLT